MGPVVVQRGVAAIPNGTASWAPTITLSATPASGNLLLTIVYGNPTAMTAATGWTQDAAFASGAYNIASFYKYAGSSESTTQTPVTTSEGLASLIMWEVTNVQGSWAKDHVATTGAASSTANTSDSVSLTTSKQDVLILAGWAGNCTVGTGGAAGSLSALTVTTQLSNTLGGPTPLYMMAMAGELAVTASGTAITDNWGFSPAAYNNKIYIQLTSDYIPDATQGVSQITAYSLTGAPVAQQAAKVTAYSLTGAPVAMQVSKITGYTMVGPRPNSAYVWVMS